MAEQSMDRIRAWENRTGGFINVGGRGKKSPKAPKGVPF